jgi:hypothetical protein
MHVRRSRFALITSALLVGVGLSCTSGGTPATPSSTATPTASPTPTATASATSNRGQTPTPSATPDLERSRAVVDEVIAAVEAKDVDALEGLVRFRDVRCDGLKEYNGPPFPDCAGAELSSPVPAFPAGVCNAVWHRDPRAMLERFVERSGELVAVIEGPGDSTEYEWWAYEDERPTWDYRVVFSADPAGEPVGYVAAVSAGRLDLMQLGCNSLGDALRQWSDSPPAIIRRGPAFVEPTTTPTPTATPDPGLAARGERTGNAFYDGIIEAMASRDATRILDVLTVERMQCTFATDLGGPPRCPDGEPEGTVVEAFLTAGCEGSWGSADLPAAAEWLASRDAELYAIVGDEGKGGRVLITYAARSASESDTLLYLSSEGVVGYATLACSEAADFANWYPVIFRGPAWPGDGE